MNSKQANIRALIEKANEIYRASNKDSELSDTEYDYLLSLIDDQDFKDKVGIEVKRNKVSLPINMGSLNKIKNLNEVVKWSQSHKINLKTSFILTPKFDGLSLLVVIKAGQFSNAFTRGDGIIGQDVTEYFKITRLGCISLPKDFNGYLIGEAIMAEKTFELKYKNKFKNPRNMVAGLLSRKELSEELQDVDFLAFGVYDKIKKLSKLEEVSFCNQYNNWLYSYKLRYFESNFADINDNDIQKYFELEKHYQCDGVVITINDKTIQEQLGYETGKFNPAWARAWKPESADFMPTEVLDILWQVSKQGYQKPVVQVEPIDLGGVTISNVTGINAKFIADNAIGKGAIVNVIRSGDVIPKITKVILPVEDRSSLLPELCVSCGIKLGWNENEIELQCSNLLCDERIISANIDFFKVLEIEEIGEGIVQQLYQSSYKSIKAILNLSIDDLLSLDGFKERKAEKVFNSIHTKLNNIPLAKLQHASNLFKGLGTKKLALTSQFDGRLNKPSIDELLAIEGFSETLSKAYLTKIDSFWDWVEELPVVILPYVKVEKKGPWLGRVFVFSGFRDSLLEKAIEDVGGEIKSSVSLKTYALIVKEKNEKSSKIEKAKKLAVNIFNKEELQKQMKVISSS